MSKRPLNRWISALHIVLIVSMLVPTLSIISSERAQAAGDVPSAPNYQTARELASSADIRTYLPEELFLPFENERASSPWDFLDQKIPSPQELIPTLGGSQATQAQSSDPESQLALAQRYAQVLQTEATTGNAAAGKTENALEPIWHQPTLPASTRQAALDVSTEITNSTVTASQNAAFSVYLPAVLGRTDSATVTPPVSQPTESYTLVSPDGVVTLRAPVSNFDSEPTFQYVALGADAPNVAPLANAVVTFGVAASDPRTGAAIPYLKQAPATLTIVYPATASAAQALRGYGYDANSGSWFSLPTSIDAAAHTATIHTSVLTVFALVDTTQGVPVQGAAARATLVTGAIQDPCAIPVALLADSDRNGQSNDFPFRNADRDGNGDVIPKGTYYPETPSVFPNYVGTDVWLSSTDTGSMTEADPTAATPLQTKDKIKMTFPPMPEDTEAPANGGPFEKDHAGIYGPENVTPYVAANPIDIPIPGDLTGAMVQRKVYARTVTLELSHRDSDQWGSSGYYLVRDDYAPPVFVEVWTEHDGAGGVNIYVTAYDNCAVKGLIVGASNSVGGGMSVQFEYLGVSPDGLGLYRAAVYLGIKGTNTYAITMQDMADYRGNNPVTVTYTEPATNQAGVGLRQLANKCLPQCGGKQTSGGIGDPISTANGNFTMNVTDAMLPGIGDTDLEIVRTYNSGLSSRYYSLLGPPQDPVGIFGVGWNSPFQFEVELWENLPLVGPGVVVIYPDGHSARYAGAGGVLTPVTPGETNKVTRSGSQVVLEDIHALKTYRFQAAALPGPTKPVTSAKLVQETDANGNSITYTPGEFGPTQISNGARTLTLAYQNVTDAYKVKHGLVQSITGPEGLSLSYTYDTARLLLISATDARGQTTRYTYDGLYRLTNVTSPKGHDSMQLSYTPDNRVKKQTLGATQSYTFGYDDGAGIVTVTDSLGKTETHYYDGQDRLIELKDALGFSEKYSYDSNDYRKTLTDKRGSAWQYGYDANGNLSSSTGPAGYSYGYTYNALNRPLSITDSNSKSTNFGYDGAGNLISITDAASKSMAIGYDGAGQPISMQDFNGNTTQMTYTGAGDLQQVTNAAGERVTFGYDGLGRMTSMSTHEGAAFSFTYDVASQLVYNISGPLGYAVSYGYDANGNLVSESDPRGATTTHEYDTSENLKVSTNPASIGGAMGYTYDAMNNLTSVTDEEGHTTSFVYDDVYQVIAVHAPENRNSSFVFDGNGNVTRATDGEGRATNLTYDGRDRLTEVKDALNGVTTFTYDPADNLLALKDTNNHTTQFGYDALNRLLQVTNPEGEITRYGYDNNGNLTSVIDGENNATALTYDRANRLETVQNAEAETTRFAYDSMGNITRMVQPNSVAWAWTYDALYHMEKLVQNEQPGQPGSSAVNVTYGFVHDRNGNLTQITDPEGNVTGFVYDDLNRLTEETDALTQKVIYTYDKVGNLRTVRNRRGFATRIEYDAANRMVEVFDPLNGNSSYRYDRADNLIGYTDENRHAVALSYDALNRVQQVTNPEGNTIQLGYDAVGNVIRYTDARGAVSTYGYDQADRLTSVTDALSGLTTLVYNNEGRPVQVTDANGHTTAVIYDKVYRALSTTNGEGETTAFVYDDNGNVTQVTDGEFNVTLLTYDPLDRMISVQNAEGESTQFAYDRMGNLTRLVNPKGVVSTWTYDALYRMKQYTENAQSGQPSDHVTNITWRFEYDAEDNLTKSTDAAGNATNFVFDALNRLTTETNALGNTSLYGYDAVGNLTTLTNRRGFVTRYAYDKADRLTEIFDALNGNRSYQYDPNDNVIKEIDENRHETTLAYDALNRVERATNPEGHAVQWGYDAVNNVTRYTDARASVTTFVYDRADRLTDVHDAEGGRTQLVYDNVSNVKQVIDANGHSTNFAYDRVYRVLAVTDAAGYATRYSYDDAGNVTQVIDGNSHATAVAYDALDRITGVTNAENETSRFGYDAMSNLLTITEADGITKRYHYDALYQLTGVTLNAVAGGPANSDTNVLYQYGYDANGNLTTITDPLTHATSFAYDALDRLSRETNPLGKTWDYEYDPAGNLVKKIDGNDAVTAYSYFPDDQLRQIAYDDGKTATFGYDANNNLTLMNDWLGVTEMSYDRLDRVTSVDDALGRTLRYGYDAAGNLTSLTYPQGGTVRYNYYDNDWLQSITDTDGGVTSYTRDGVGQMTETRHANGTVTRAEYDQANRLLFQGHYENATGDVIQSTRYTLDDVGMRTSAQVVYGRPWPKQYTENYEYDGLRRLTVSNNDQGFTSRYSYDAAGNRTAWQASDDLMTETANDAFAVAYSYNAANQLLNANRNGGQEVTSYGYDGNGNRVNEQTVTAGAPYIQGKDYGYDRADRLTSVTNYRVNASLNAGQRRNQDTTALSYDGLGRRLVKEYNELESQGRLSQQEYTFDGLDPVAEYPVYSDGEFVGRNNHRNEYYRDETQQIVTQRRFPNGVAAQTYQYHSDGRQDVVSLTDESQRAWTHYEYDAYGQLLPEWGNLAYPEYKEHNEFTFSGQEWDAQIETYTYYARAYEPTSGVWTNQDRYRGALSNPVTLHRMGFVSANPINVTDLYGYFGLPSWDDVASAVGGAVDATTDAVGGAIDVTTSVVGGAIDITVNAANDVAENVVETAEAAGQWAVENQDVIVKGAITVAAIGGTAALCAATAGVGCVVGAAVLAGTASYGSQVVDNAWVAGGSSSFNWQGEGVFTDINWQQVAVDTAIGGLGAGIGQGASKVASTLLKGCQGGGCAYGVSAVSGFLQGTGIQMLTNVLDGDSCTGLWDNAGWSGLTGSAFSMASTWGSNRFNANRARITPEKARDIGNQMHYDVKSGGTGRYGPSQLSKQFPDTEFHFAPRGAKGVDVTVMGGMHPSQYPGSTWPSGIDVGDFKPNTVSGRQTFASDIAKGKLPVNTIPIPYDPARMKITGEFEFMP